MKIMPHNMFNLWDNNPNVNRFYTLFTNIVQDSSSISAGFANRNLQALASGLSPLPRLLAIYFPVHQV